MFTWLNERKKSEMDRMWNYLKNIELEKIVNSNGQYKIPFLWKNDFDVVLSAVQNGCCNLRSIPLQWRTNKQIMSAFLTNNPLNLRLLPQFQDDEEIVCLLIMKNPFTLQHASQRLKNTASVVRLATMTKNFSMLNFASDELKNNRVFMMEMIRRGRIFAFSHVSDQLKNNAEFLLEVLMKESYPTTIFYQIPNKFRMNEDFVLTAALMNDEPYHWIQQKWTYRLDEITPGLADKLIKKGKENKEIKNKKIQCSIYEALITLAAEREKEFEKRKIRVPARIYMAGAIYGILRSRRLMVEETNPVQQLPHIPFEIALKISEFSPIYFKKSRAISGVNRDALSSAETAMQKARDNGSFNFMNK